MTAVISKCTNSFASACTASYKFEFIWEGKKWQKYNWSTLSHNAVTYNMWYLKSNHYYSSCHSITFNITYYKHLISLCVEIMFWHCVCIAFMSFIQMWHQAAMSQNLCGETHIVFASTHGTALSIVTNICSCHCLSVHFAKVINFLYLCMLYVQQAITLLNRITLRGD